MRPPTEPYLAQCQRWPAEGQHILAHFDDSSVVVYQAYRPSTGQYAIAHGRLGGPDFSFNRMSWIKPNFLWMMFRSGWGTKPGQEVTLGLRIRRPDGSKVARRAIQLGLRGNALRALAGPELLEVIDMTPFVEGQRAHAASDWAVPGTPVEWVYEASSQAATVATR